MAAEFESDLWGTVDQARKWLVDLNAVNSFHLTGRITLVQLMWKWMDLFLKKNYVLRAWDCLFLLNWIGTLTLSLLLKQSPRKVESWALIRPVTFLPFEVALYLYKCTIRPCTEYCCHIWTGTPSCFLNKLDKLQKDVQGCWSLESLTYRWNVASLDLFFRYHFGRFPPNMTELIPLPYSLGRSTRYSNRLHEFSVVITILHKGVCVNCSFRQTGSGILCLQNVTLRPTI